MRNNKFIKWIKKLWSEFRSSRNSYVNFLIWILFGIFIVFFIELISRGTPLAVREYAREKNWIYLFNINLIWGITLPIFFIKRKFVYYSIIFFISIILAIVNKIIIGIRGVPLTFSDFYLLKEGLSIANKYISFNLVIGIVIAAVIFIVLIIFLSYIERRNKRFIGSMVTFVSIALVLILLVIHQSAVNKGELTIYQWDLKYSYEENGFLVSFANSYNAYKRKKPIEYTKKNMEAIRDNINHINSEIKIKPNVLLVQLEGFFDPYIIKNIELSSDPLSNFRNYCNTYTSGIVDVSTFGGGTARSDFESQTGMSMDYFSPGEIPYNTVLKKQPVESIAYILKPYGYKSFAVHNYVGNFYGRDKGFSNLGFDNYISREYMTSMEFSETYWPKDRILTQHIKEALLSTEEPDYIYTITVQTHGPYGTIDVPNKGITLLNNLEEKYKKEIECYANELNEVDIFIKDLINMIESLNEPTVIAFFGDHQPSLSILESNISGVEDIYKTPYFIYDNIKLPKKDEDIELYELSTKILTSLGIENGIMPQVHRKYSNNEYYEEILKLVQYDVLFGENYVANFKELYQTTPLTMGVRPITIKSLKVMGKVDEENQQVNILGENFTQYSQVFLGDKGLETKVIDNNNIQCYVPINSELNNLTVKQIGQYNAVLSSSDKYSLP